MTKSNTPRADEAVQIVRFVGEVVPATLARSLEKELNEARAEIERLTPAASKSRTHFFRPKGFNHGVYEVEYSGDEKPTAQDVIDAAMKFAGSDKIYFTISQRIVDHRWENWRRYGYCEFSLCVERYDGRSYLHG